MASTGNTATTDSSQKSKKRRLDEVSDVPGREAETSWNDEDFLSLGDSKPSAKQRQKVSAPESDNGEDDNYMDQSSTTSSNDSNNKTGRPPWMRDDEAVRKHQRIHPCTALHNEIVSFVHLMEPQAHEIAQRNKLVDRIRATVHQHFNKETTELVVFGSQATGLLLPSSDIDLVVMTKDDEEDTTTGAEKIKIKGKKKKKPSKDYTSQHQTPLRRFAQALKEDWYEELSYLETIEHTRVPLVKFCHAPTNISVDVCFNQPSGPPAAQLMKGYLEALPPLRPLTYVLKYFLAARGLNEPYSGGVGSFMLQLLIVAFLQQRERDAVKFRRPSVYNLGSLLLEFLELYGLHFNCYTTGVSVRYDGFFFPKGASDRRLVFCKPDRPGLLAVENPLDPTQDVGQSSFRYQIVQRAFALAYRTLLAHVTARPSRYDRALREAPSILACILPPTSYMTSRLVTKRRNEPLSVGR